MIPPPAAPVVAEVAKPVEPVAETPPAEAAKKPEEGGAKAAPAKAAPKDEEGNEINKFLGQKKEREEQRIKD